MDDVRAVLTPKKKSSRRAQLVSFAGVLFSFMLLLSLLSYSAADQAAGELGFGDLWKVFTNDPAVREQARQTSNVLGLLGALVSNVLINSTIGYAVVLLPVLGILWSLALLRRRDVRPLLIVTNYSLALAILCSALCGAVRLTGDSPILPGEWSGVAGDFLANVLVNLIGLFGTYLVLIGLIAASLILLFDIDVLQSYEQLRKAFVRTSGWLDRAGSLIGRFVAASKQRLERSRPAKVQIKTPEPEPAPVTRRPMVEAGPLKFSDFEEPPRPEVRREAPESNEELRLDIREAVTEEEVDFDARKQEEQPEEEIDFVPPSVDLLDAVRAAEQVDESELKANAELLRSKLADFGVAIDSVSVTPGPVVTLYELVPATGVKISRIESLEDDIALAMKAKGIRIIAPIPGKGTVGVEIPNHHPSLVTIRSVINSSKFRDSRGALPLALGKTITGEVYIDDLARMPHLLIAGATGSGKSVGINTILSSLIYRLHPSDVKFVIIDPKKIELAQYRQLRHHYLAVSPDIQEDIITTPQNAVLVLKSVELEMEKRYDRLAAAGVRNIADYNEKVKSGRLHDTETMRHRKLPYLIIVIDELADLMITAAKEVEEPIARLAQLARAVGIHLVLATQRPSVDVITGVIKANFPARIAYQVATKIDSRTILDMNGAEQLLGNGDMLYFPPGSPKPIRIQNAFISTAEVEGITTHIGRQKGYSQPLFLPSAFEKKKTGGATGDGSRDELFEEAARIIVRHQQGSVSLLQRRLKVGYSRAARLVDELEAAGVVGPFDGSKARDVLVESEAELESLLRNLV
ncbi:MAG: hypothetical protein HBSIN02_08300 [Bacteroidia bacterium]|nr:MAG: hypothetical protein HBSIN02_08300 [Bacteroidia bacterium]